MAFTKREEERLNRRKSDLESGRLRGRTPATIPAVGTENAGNGRFSGAAITRMEGLKTKIRDGSLNRSAKVDDDYINSFLRDSRDFLAGAQTRYNSLDYKGATDDSFGSFYDETYKTERDLGTRSHWIRNYLNTHKHEIAEDTYSQLTSYLDQFDSADVSQLFADARNYYTQWDSEDDYQAYLGQKKKYDAVAGADVAAVEKEIEEMEKELDLLKQGRTPASSHLTGGNPMVNGMPYAAGAQQSQTQGSSYLTGNSLINGRPYDVNAKQNSISEEDRKNGDAERQIADLEKRISERKQFLAQANRIQEGKRLSGVTENEDFDQFSGYVNSEHTDRFLGFIPVKDEDITYEYINASPEDRSYMEQKYTTYLQENVIGKGYGNLTDEEKAIYNYHYAKGGEEEATKYLDSIQDTLNMRQGQIMYGNMPDNAALKIAFGMAVGYDQFESGMEGFADVILGEDTYTAPSAIQYAGSMIREDLGDTGPKLPEWMGGASLGQVGYDTVTTTSNMVPSILTSVAVNMAAPGAGSVAGTAMLGASAAGNAYQEKINAGYSKEQAQAYGLMVGASEMLLEKFLGGISALGGGSLTKTAIKNLDKLDNVLSMFARSSGGKILMNAGSEAFEEGLQSILEPFMWQAVSGEEVGVDWEETLYSSLLGFATGGMFEGGSTAVNTAIQNTEYAKTGKSIMATGGGVDALMQLANEMSVASSADVRKGIARQVGKVGRKSTATGVGRLYDTVQTANTIQNQADIAKSLERKGFDTETANDLASALVARHNGTPLTAAQSRLLESAQHSEAVQDAVSGILLNQKSTMGQREQKFQNFHKRLVGEKTIVPPTETVAASEIPQEDKDMPAENVPAETSYEASADGKTIRKSTGEVVNIREIASVKDGKMLLRLDDGTEAESSDIAYANDGEALIYETVAGLGCHADAANLLVSAYYTGDVSAQQYAEGIREAFEYGRFNIPEQEMIAGDAFANNLTPHQRNTAYKIGQLFGGREIGKEHASVRSPKKHEQNIADGQVHFDGDLSKLNEMQKSSLSSMEMMAKAMGVQIYVFESEVDTDGKRTGVNGWYDPSDGSIHIDLYAGVDGNGTMLFTMAHELTHFIRQWSPAKFKVLANFLMQQYSERGVSVRELVDNQIAKAKRNGRTIHRDTAYEEVIADSMETMLADGNVMQMMADLRQQDKTVWQKICGWFKDFADKLKAAVAAYQDAKPDSPEGKMVSDMQDVIIILEALYSDALADASENYAHRAKKNTAYDGDILYSLNPNIHLSDRDATLHKIHKTLEQENEQLREDVTYLKELLSFQRKVTGGTKFTKRSVEAAARLLKKTANAKGNTKELAGLLNSFYEYIATERELSWELVKEQAQPAVAWLQDHVDLKPQRSEYAHDILKHLRGSKVYLDESQQAEAGYRYGSYNAYRKALMGSITFSKDAGMSLDSLWHELSELYPAVFDSSTSASDMPSALVDIIDALRNSDTTAAEYAYNREAIAMDLLRQVYDSYWKVSTLYTVADSAQKKINALKSKHFQQMSKLREGKNQIINQIKAEHRESLAQVKKAYRSDMLIREKEIADRYQASRKKGIENRTRTAMRHKIQNVVGELNRYLLNGNKEKHVMIGLQKAVAEALDAVNMDTVGAEERIANLEAELLKAKSPEKIQEISRKIDRVRSMGDRMQERLKSLKDAYRKIADSDDPLIANSHDDVIEAKMESAIEKVGDTPLRDMTLSQLEEVYDMYRMVLTTIRNANKAFKAAKNETITELGNRVMEEVSIAGGKKKLNAAAIQAVEKFGWNILKPVYAFSHIGSDTFTGIFNRVRSGEDTWAKDVVDARAYYLEKSRKYGYDSWDFGKRFDFTSTSNMAFSLNLEQIMSLYAYSKRPQAADHLRKGGIVFDESTEITMKTKLGIPVKFNPTEATAYNISLETLSKIIDKLTPDQKGFVDEMQDYLSTVMGEKGNQVSLEMYGVKLFKEKFYFPLKSAQQFMAKAKEQQQGDVKIKNSGFSKETVKNASNPIVLTPFMNVWANHVNEMSMYHAFVLPMEDFYRVYNFRTPTSESAATKSVEMFIQNAYGSGATKYIDQLLRDLNGGARTDSTTGVINKTMGLFKKGAVFASLSVVVQQPSAIARAAALVDTKYFIGPKVDHKKHKALWDEVKRYAPVAIIKEMGYFDTNMGKSTQDYILGKEYDSFGEKMKALVTDGGYRDEILSKAPALADEIAWCSIWEAVKRETKAKKPAMDVNSEVFLQEAGARFTEVITKTQVYDSVLSRSAMMRSKDTGMKMATAFMAEPTTSINMIADALLQGKRGNKKYARSAVGAVIASQILNSILVSFVYAARDDDEDKTYWEKYLGTLTAEAFDSLNPLTYIPFIKDIVSIVQGYDVERSDMAIISDLWNAYKQLDNENVSIYRKVESFGGSIAQFFGLPVKNIMRDGRAIYQTVMSFVDGEQTTLAGIGQAIRGSLTGKTVSNQQQLYEAIMSGDEKHITRIKGRFKDQRAVDSAIRMALRENDPRIREAAIAKNNGDLNTYLRLAREIVGEKRFSQDQVVAAINAEVNALSKGGTGSTSSKVSGLFKPADFAVALSQGDSAMAGAIKRDIINTERRKGKTAETAEKYFNSTAKTAVRELFFMGELSEQIAVNALTDYCSMDEAGAVADVRYWAFKKNYPDLRVEDSWFDSYYEEISESGIEIATYMEYRNKVSGITGKGRKENRMEIIDSLPLTNDQKDALYFAEGWAESKLDEAPWH